MLPVFLILQTLFAIMWVYPWFIYTSFENEMQHAIVFKSGISFRENNDNVTF
jgi:hypothetical protein